VLHRDFLAGFSLDQGLHWVTPMSRLRSQSTSSNLPAVASVLVVDDDLVVGRSLCRALQALRPDFRFELATSGEAALAHVRQNPCDVIVTDLDMGRVSGSELLEILARDYPRILRIVHSSQNEALISLELRHLVHASLDKPARPTHIAELIDRELDATK
jgi:DNA-binding NtrC family response regulator